MTDCHCFGRDRLYFLLQVGVAYLVAHCVSFCVRHTSVGAETEEKQQSTLWSSIAARKLLGNLCPSRAREAERSLREVGCGDSSFGSYTCLLCTSSTFFLLSLSASDHILE